MDCQVKVAVLEEKVDHFERLVSKLDSAIEKIAEVNNNVSRMLAVHEERITKQEETDELLFSKVDKFRDKVDRDHESLSSRVSTLERKLWISVAIIGLVMVATNPASLEHVKGLMTSNSRPAIMAVHARPVDGSR